MDRNMQSIRLKKIDTIKSMKYASFFFLDRRSEGFLSKKNLNPLGELVWYKDILFL